MTGRGTLGGRRLLLRPLEEGAAAAVLEAIGASRAQLKRRFGWVEAALSIEDILRFIREQAAAWGRGEAAAFGIFVRGGGLSRSPIESRPSGACAPLGRLVGVLGLDPIVRRALRAQLSLWIRGDEQDKGYAIEAGRLAVEYAFGTLALHRLSARIDPTNRAARRVLQRLGFRYEGCLRQEKRIHQRWVDQECWGMLRSERSSRRPGGLGRAGRPGGARTAAP